MHAKRVHPKINKLKHIVTDHKLTLPSTLPSARDSVVWGAKCKIKNTFSFLINV